MSVPLASSLFASDHLGAAPAMTDAEIAALMGVSKALIFHLRMRAMSKIREAVLNDPDLRDLVEEVVGRRLAEPERCDRPGCESTSDVRDVLLLVAGEYKTPARLCKSCRCKNARRARLVRARDLALSGETK